MMRREFPISTKIGIDSLLVNRYRVLEELGRGGMGIVWKVYDIVEHKEVALKQFFGKVSPCESGTQNQPAALATGKTMQAGEVNKTVSGLGAGLTVTGAEVNEPLEGDDIFATPAAQTKRIEINIAATLASEAELRFKQEFRTMVKLRHPNTVHVYDFGKLENGEDYITMEIVPGKELRDIIRERQLDIPEIYRILIQTTQVLNFIHSRLLVHRDIKPDNIRLTPEGNVKIMDFGLMEQMGMPSNGEIAGTPLYMPPEVTRGGIIDTRSDLYSLGIMAYELTTGKIPFLGTTILEIIKKHIEESPASIRQLRGDIPEELEKVILRLIAKEPDDRYQTTAELINDLAKLSSEKVPVETLEQRKSYLNCSELIGRAKEMQELKDLFEIIKKGKGQSIFIGAPAGTGKTRLIQEFRLYVQLAGVTFVQGNCFEQGMIVYHALSEAFKPLLPLTKKEIVDKYGSILVKVMPELRSKGYQSAPELEEYSEKSRLFEAVTGWLKKVSEVQPLVIYIEDLHWVDMPSIDLLNACIRELRESPVMIMCSFRDDEVKSTSRIFQTVEENLTREMKLTPLNTENIGILIAKMLGRAELAWDFTEHIYTATGGNPFFVSEIMRALIEDAQLRLERGRWILPMDVSALELPSSIEATIIRRLKLLKPEALNVARIAAVVARNLDLSFIKTLSGLADEQLFDILDELIERQFMKTEDKQYVFTHDRVRETLYAQLDEETKKKIHEKTAIIIETRFSGNKGFVINELAYHFSRGLNKVKAVDYLVQAGDAGWKIRDYLGATKSWSEALEILDIIEYLNKKTVMFQIRDRVLDTSIYTNPKYCLQVCERQFQELNKLVNIKRIVPLFRMVFKIVDMLPKRIGIKIKEKMTKAPPSEKIDKDYGTIVFYMIRVHGWGSLAEYFLGNYKRSMELIDQVDYYLPDMNGVGYSAVIAGCFATLVYLGRTRDAIRRGKRAFKNLDMVERYIGLTDWFDKYVYGSFFYFLNLSSATLGMNFDRDFAARGLHYNEKEKFLDLVWYIRCLHWEWLSWRGMYKEFQKESDIAQDMLRKLGRPAAIEMEYYRIRTRIEILLFNYDRAKESVERMYLLGQQQQTSSSNFEQAEVYKTFINFKQGDRKENISQMERIAERTIESNLLSALDAMVFLAEMYLELGEIGQVQLVLSRCEDFLKQKIEEPSVVHQASICVLKSEIMRRRKEFIEAQNILKEVLRISKETDNPLLRGWFYEQMAKINIDLSQWNNAKDSLREAEKIFEEIGAERKKREVAELSRSIKD